MSGTEEITGGGFARGFIYGLILAVIGFVGFSVVNPLDTDLVTQLNKTPTAQADASSQAQQQAEKPVDSRTEPDNAEKPSAQNTPSEDAAAPQESAPQVNVPSDTESLNDASTPSGPQFGAPSVDEGSGLSIGSDTPPALATPDTQVAIASPSGRDVPAIGADAPVAPTVTDDLSVRNAENGSSDQARGLSPGKAMRDNAVPAIGSDERPYFAIILEDIGDQGIPREGLTALKAAISFGVPVDDPQASEIAQLYRNAGFEVVALLPESGSQVLKSGQTSAEVAGDLANFFEAVPNAAVVLDRETSVLPNDDALGQAVLSGLKVTGHGLLTYGDEAATLPGLAAETGVPNGQIFRIIDERPEPENINLALERAVTQAKETGVVIVTGHTSSDTITTLFAWLLGPGSSGVKIVPASAAIERLNE